MNKAFSAKVISGLDSMSVEAKQLKSKRLSEALTNRTPWNAGIKTGPIPEEIKTVRQAKEHATKKANNSFNSSKPEDNYYRYLCQKYGENNVIRQYAEDTRYPFACDFYIKSQDLFIELNFHWSHGGHLFNKNNFEDLIKLDLWKEKAKKSDFYKNAIETWTKRDVKKYNTALKNNLNFAFYYTEDELYANK